MITFPKLPPLRPACELTPEEAIMAKLRQRFPSLDPEWDTLEFGVEYQGQPVEWVIEGRDLCSKERLTVFGWVAPDNEVTISDVPLL